MIKKIKELMDIRDIISDMSKRFNENAKHVMTLTGEIESMKDNMDLLKNSQRDLTLEIKKDLDSIKEVKDDFKKEIMDFKLVKSRLEGKLVEKFSEELKEDIIPKINRIEKPIANFEALSSKVSMITDRTNSLSGELDKFAAISKSLKKEDFELTNFTTQLRSMESEKLDLLRKLDSMERLVAKQRRR